MRQRGTGCIYRQNGSGNWWIKYHRDGRAFRESTHSTDRRKAEQKLRQRLAEMATGQFGGLRVDRITVNELADDFLRDYRINARKSVDDAEARWNLHLKPFFGTYKAVNVSSDLIARYVDKRQEQKAKNGTINRELAALKRMFRLGQKATPPKVLRSPSFPTLQENNVRKGFLEDTESRKLIATNPELWFHGLVELGRTYGWRVSELLGLRVRQVDLLQRTIRLEPGTTKNKDGRQVSMTTPVYELMKQCVHGKYPDAHVITRSNGRPIRDFRGTWASACAAAGVPGLLFHDLRRTAARNLRRAGIAEGVIMKIGGWRTRSVFERYAIVSQQDIADAIMKHPFWGSRNETHRNATPRKSPVCAIIPRSFFPQESARLRTKAPPLTDTRTDTRSVSSPKTNTREALSVLKTYPVFQVLRAMAETHQLQFRPKESLKLQNNGMLDSVLDQRTLSTWNALRDCRANGMNQNEAQEVAFPNMLLPSEQEEEQERPDQEEQNRSRLN